MIDLTPLEVRKKKGDFRRAMRGYDPVLVDDFLDLVADRLEELVRENMTLRDRVSRQEQQVADYRDREKALTEALVSAQEMREEVRRQATREAELSKTSAEQHAAQLRATVEEETRRMRAEAQQEIAQLRASVQSQRDREEELLRHLHARKEEFVASYRSLLERELAELSVLARTMSVPSGGGQAAEAARPEPAKGRAATEPAKGRGAGSAPKRAPPAAEAAPAPRQRPEPPMPLEPTHTRVVDEFTGESLAEAAVDDEAALALGATPAELEFDAEPFEPEPFQPEQNDVESFRGDDVANAYRAEQSAQTDGATDTTEVSGGGTEERLYDGIAADESGDGVPGPIGLGEPEPPAPWETGWTAGGDAAGDLYELPPDDDDDPDTAALLRNAAAAGYRLTDDDIPDELLLDEAVQEDDDKPEDDGWLPTLLDDEK